MNRGVTNEAGAGSGFRLLDALHGDARSPLKGRESQRGGRVFKATHRVFPSAPVDYYSSVYVRGVGDRGVVVNRASSCSLPRARARVCQRALRAAAGAPTIYATRLARSWRQKESV